MGVWNIDIKGNDTTLDIYSSFFDKYNNGENPILLSDLVKKEFKYYFIDIEDRNNSFFGLALAQWETKCLEPETYKIVKQIIDNETDLKLWINLGADEITLNKRKEVLNIFLKQISTERPKAKRRVKPKFKFTTNELIKITSPDNTKIFRVIEEYTNQKYIHTSGILEWISGGGAGIVYYVAEGESISAKWVDNNNLELRHKRNLIFTKHVSKSSFYGDEIKIKYKFSPQG